MENFKIKATTETASEIIDLLEANGGELVVTKEQLICEVKDGFNILVDQGNGIFSTKGNYPVKEITLPQLRDMVVLKRKPMKEYLNPNRNYELVLCAEKDKEEGFIEVPEGAMFAWKLENGGIFFTGLGMGYRDASVVWHRHTQPEALPFLDDEPSLNDQYAEIEKVRQSKIDETLAERQAQYGCFEDVAFVTESIMGILSKVRGNGLQDLPNAHRMALYMIASKMARIVNGDFNHLDSWHDIGGYAKLIEKLIEGE